MAFERDGRIGNDLVAILARDPHMIVGALGILAVHLAPRSRRTNLVLRLKRDALRFQCPVIDPRLKAKLGHAGVHMIGPAHAPFLQQLLAVPVALLLTKAVRADFAHRQHDMGMGLGTAIGGLVPMDIEVGNHAARHKLAGDKIARQRDAVSLVHLPWNRKLDIARKLRVLANLARLDGIPQGFAVSQTFRRTLRAT